MADKITKDKIKKTFEIFAHTFGHRVARDYADKGAWILDYNSTYGGYLVAQLTAGGGEGLPLGPERKSPRAFYEAMWFAIRAADASKRAHSGSPRRRRTARR